MRNLLCAIAFVGVLAIDVQSGRSDEGLWRPLPLISEGKVHPNWTHIGHGRFSVDEGTLRTDCSAEGMGLLVYKPEKFGDCRIRVVYRSKDARSNAGVYIRIDDGILAAKQPAPVERDAQGKLSREMLARLEASADAEEGPWYAVHHGFEVQICDGADAAHRTGAIYSLSKAAAITGAEGAWRTMIITLKGNLVQVEVNGREVSRLDSTKAEASPNRQFYEPKLTSMRPQRGYLGLQNHDPGDVVWFKEISIQPLSP